MKDRVMHILGLASGEPDELDGEYIVDYEPGRHLITTADRAKATRYDALEAIELWRAIDPYTPRRPDGKPNRPLSAYSVQIEYAD
jgi:hypothetical protein